MTWTLRWDEDRRACVVGLVETGERWEVRCGEEDLPSLGEYLDGALAALVVSNRVVVSVPVSEVVRCDGREYTVRRLSGV